ncbi:L,D-transpeptidase family protein [Sinorhizobium fredii]|uniref:L,D-transpeptidase family protein n=1 Tax=Rhizobium fredii TaxID=380 RepID=UPI000595697E|nr:L,D-transpeptidase family protein [Sinorhizobium fredii]WOS63648.1 L,D-transpeptidase family protein [Sinorhizobium fredii GR64]
MSSLPVFSRRQFLRASGLAIASAGLAGCTSSMNTDRFRQQTMPVYRDPALESRWVDPGMLEEPLTGLPPQDAYYADVYADREDGGFLIPAVPYQQIDPRFYRQEVSDPFGEAPGTIVVDTADRYLYLIGSGGSATRYGVGLGREGFAWSGRGVIQWKQKWPKWTPPDSMIARQPVLAKYSADNGGMPPGLDNPLGSRALYIFQNGQDTLYRVHGTPEWQSIGKAVSSGCVRMINQDVIDLYARVRGKAPILVI